MEKRAYDRIPVNLGIRFICDDSLYSGIATNLSEKGMCINAVMCLSFDPNAEMNITLKEEDLTLTAKVKRITMTDSFYDTLGLEVLNPSKEYLELVNSLRLVCKS